MAIQTINEGPLTATLRECWVDATNLRLSYEDPDRQNHVPLIHTLVLESVMVEAEYRRRGHFKRFLAGICADPCFEMVIVEGGSKTQSWPKP